MKVLTTRKHISDNYNCIAIGFCGIQNLLQYEHANFYINGVYGWNFDAYVFTLKNGREICVTTGYREMINNCKNNYSFELSRKYDKQAETIIYDSSLSFEQKKEKVKNLLNDFLEECFKEF